MPLILVCLDDKMEWQIREHYYEWDTLYLKCSYCKEFFSSDNFSKDRTKRFGLNGRCKKCDKLHRRTRYLNNLEIEKERKKIYYITHKDDFKKNKKKRRQIKNGTFWINIHKFYEKMRKYINKNNLRPKQCSICGLEGRIEFHHPSYSNRDKRKEWVFVCTKCHKRIHSWELECPEPIDLVQLNAHMPRILTDKDLELCKR